MAIISLVISIVALLVVVASLLLQARALRTSQLQAARAAHFQMVQAALERPELFPDPSDPHDSDPEVFAKKVFLNMTMKYWQLSYSLRTISDRGVRIHARRMFAVPFRREWWSEARDYYLVEAISRTDRRFVALVESAFFEHATSPRSSEERPPDTTIEPLPTHR
jgi:hypothetical protein